MPWVATGSMDRSVKVWRIGDVASSPGKKPRRVCARAVRDWALVVELGLLTGASRQLLLHHLNKEKHLKE